VRSADTGNVRLHWGINIPLRDGVRLNATLYTGTSSQPPAPCIFTLTPYISDHCHERAAYFAARGLPFLVVDVRGRGNSEGLFRPNIQEACDGYDVVEWLASRPYCSGKVAMWGGSYLGYSQWAVAKETPPHLATIVPTAAPYLGVDFPMRNNIFYPYLVQWLTYTAGHASQGRVFADLAFWSGIYKTWHKSGRSFRDVASVYGNHFATFQEWLSHPEPDAYWDAYNPTAEQYARIQIPTLTITGSYDDDQPGALEHYKQLMQVASPAAQHYLIIGPWDHAGTAIPQTTFGGLTVGSASLIDLPRLHLEWYQWTMLDGPRPEFLKKPVAYYVMGAERWRYADTLEAITARHEALFLQSAGNANDVFASGAMSTVVGTGPPDAYTYDPRDVDGAEVEAEADATGDSLVDQTVLFALRPRLLVYHSAPLEQDMEVSGFLRLTAWISIDCPDTDLYVSVYEIARDGSSILLSTDAIRARYREGLRTPKLITTREPLRYDFDRFTFVSRQLRRGHRLRLVIAPVGRVIQMIFTEKNYNGGRGVAEETSEHARPVTVHLFHDAARPSALYVPIGHVATPTEASAATNSLRKAPAATDCAEIDHCR
jgi:putative CocE/NonD family hydrolase